MRIVALDPGGTTGIAYFDTAREQWNRRELTSDHHMDLYDILYLYNPDVVIYERLNYQRRGVTNGIALRLDSVEYIGVIKLAKQLAQAGRAAWTDFILVDQQPSVRTWWNDERLKALGLWVSSPHERD